MSAVDRVEALRRKTPAAPRAAVRSDDMAEAQGGREEGAESAAVGGALRCGWEEEGAGGKRTVGEGVKERKGRRLRKAYCYGFLYELYSCVVQVAVVLRKNHTKGLGKEWKQRRRKR